MKKKEMSKNIFKISIILLASFLSSLALILSPFYLGKAIDLMTTDLLQVKHLLLLTLTLYIVSSLFNFFSAYLSHRLAISVVSDLRKKLFDRLLSLRLSYLDTHSHGNLASVFSMDAELVLDGLVQFLSQASSSIFVIIISSIMMLSINVWMAMIVFITIPVVYFVSSAVSKKSSKLYKIQQDLFGEVNNVSSEYVDNFELVLSLEMQEDATKRFSNVNDTLNHWGEKAQFISAISNPTTRVVNNLSYTLMGLSGAFVIWKFGMSVGVFTSFISYSMLFSKPFNEFTAVISQISLGRAAYHRMQEVLSIPIENDVSGIRDMKGLEIEFKNVSFAYDSKNPLITDLNLDIKPLSKVAIVGPTGAGKSTLINLLMRYYDVNEGDIAIDGVSVSDTSRASVRDLMGVVLQDPWLFSGTIYENIAYGKENASKEDVYEAALQAGCYDDIIAMDDGFDSHLNDVSVSLGQMQMITIARALIGKAPILILDEATSSIDSLSEKHIQEVFTEIMSSHTSFFVAHRLSTVIDSDIILVMRDGKIVEKGNHKELMAKKGFYHELYQSQY